MDPKVTYKEIDSKVDIQSDGLFSKRIFIGNTGLLFINSNNNWRWHFMPDGYASSQNILEDESGNVTKFVKVFGYAFYSFYLWYLDNRNFKKFKRPNEISAGTNLVMVNFLRRILGDKYIEIGENLSDDQQDGYSVYECKILVKELFEDQQVLETLKSFYLHVQRRPLAMEK